MSLFCTGTLLDLCCSNSQRGLFGTDASSLTGLLACGDTASYSLVLNLGAEKKLLVRVTTIT